MNLNPFEWARKFKRPFLLDGAIGTVLHSKFPGEYESGIWMTNLMLKHPEILESLHLSYIEAGADIITTFTFRTSPYNLKPKGLDSEVLVKLAVNLCVEARKKASNPLKPVLIAGSNATMSRCYYSSIKNLKDEEIYENHLCHIKSLMNSGVDFVLNETFGHLNEIRIVCDICKTNKIPYVMSIYCDENLKLLTGESVIEAIEVVKKYDPLAISFNCVKYSTMNRILNEVNLKDLNWGCYINCGDESMQENYSKLNGELVDHVNVLDFAVSPEELTQFYDKIVKEKGLNPGFFGSCCCSNPDHTKKLTERFLKN